MNLNLKYQFFIEHSLFNFCDSDTFSYYSPERNVLENHPWSFENDQELIQLPFSDEHRGTTWAFFWESLSDDEAALAQSFSGPGFFEFMRETGLDENFNEAEIRMKKELIESWEQEHKLAIDYENAAVIYCDD